MKRIALALGLIPLALLTAAYYLFPQHAKEPLVSLNRTLSNLTEKTTTLQSHTVHYLEGGQGETVVLLHGIFAEKDHWVDFARGLTDSYHVVAPDLPGFGESSRLDDQAYDYASQTQRLKALLDTLGIQRAHFAGNSMGGTLAALFALRYPERVASLAFIGAPHGIRSPVPSEMDKQIDAGKMPLIARNETEFEQMMSLVFAERPFLPYPIVAEARAGAIRHATSNVRLWKEQLNDRHLLHERIAGLKTTTLVLWGSGDLVFDASGAQVMQSALSHPQVHVLPGIGHLPMMEAPKKTSTLYANFLNDVRNAK